MNDNDTKRCPKCSGEMVPGILSVYGAGYEINWRARKSIFATGQKVIACRCKQCGFTELFSVEFPQGEI